MCLKVQVTLFLNTRIITEKNDVIPNFTINLKQQVCSLRAYVFQMQMKLRISEHS